MCNDDIKKSNQIGIIRDFVYKKYPFIRILIKGVVQEKFDSVGYLKLVIKFYYKGHETEMIFKVPQWKVTDHQDIQLSWYNGLCKQIQEKIDRIDCILKELRNES